MPKKDSSAVAGQSTGTYVFSARYDSDCCQCRYFHVVLDALVLLAPDVIRLPDENTIPAQIHQDPRFFPYFKDFIGALDGTHIHATPPKATAPAFRNRKGHCSQNVLAAISFDLKFVYVLAGWEGSASDAAIFNDALTKGLLVPDGKYYLGDAGYGLGKSCLTPYRAVRYHLREWSLGSNKPENAKELYNLRHAGLRNAIERIFGVLKKRFPILTTFPDYPFETQVLFNLSSAKFTVVVQVKLVFAVCVLHDLIMDGERDQIFWDRAARHRTRKMIRFNRVHRNTRSGATQSSNMLGQRDALAEQMRAHYCMFEQR
jgi:hypothetical protein